MPKKLLLFAALAVVGSMLILWLATKGSNEAQSSSSSSTDETVADRSNPQRRDRTNPQLAGDQSVQPSGEQAPRDRDPNRNPINADPSRPQGSVVEGVPRGTHAGEVTEPPLEYTLPDGRKVRDFRSPDKRVPLDVPPTTHVPGGRTIKPELTGLFTDQILAHLKECGKSVPKESRGVKPRLEGQIIIAIKGEQAQVTSAVFKLTEIPNAQLADAAKQCVEAKALTVKVPATGEQDLDSYSINMSFAFL